MPTQLSPGVNVTEIDLTTIVPAVATSTGAISGIFNWGPVGQRVLIDSETTLVNTFGKPNSNNAETFFTAANFLGYTNALWVVRAANTTSSNTQQGAKNAFANVGSVSNTPTVLNSTDFAAKLGYFDNDVLYIAKYPGGTYGDSLRVSVCDSVNAFSSNVSLTANADVYATLTTAIGSNTISVLVQSISANALASNAFAYSVANSFVLGDLIGLGNTAIGVQYASISAITGVAINGSNASFTISTYDPYRQGTVFIANGASTNTTSSQVINRRWEFFNSAGAAPITSAFVSQFGNSAAVDTMHIVVQDENGAFTGQAGTILETFTNVSRATDGKNVDGTVNYYQTVINNESNYIWAVNDRSGSASATAANVASSSSNVPLSLSFVNGSDGYSEGNVPLSTISTGYSLFQSPEDVDISLILQGKPIGGTTSSQGFTVNNFQLANWIIDNICAIRKDCVAFITPDDSVVSSNPGNQAAAVVAWRDILHDSSYAVLDSGYKYQYDRYNDINRYLPTNADIAGLCARTDNQRDPWWSPAGFNRGQIKNVIQMRWNPKQSSRDLLYGNGINPVISIPGQGTLLYGDKTLQSKPSAFDRINVRRLFIVLEKAISTAAKYSLFEFNDAFTQAQFKNLVVPYLRQIQGRRGITDFLVVCDSTNNTPAVVDANQFVGDIYIKPARSINFIQLNFVAVGTGVAFSEVVGKF
jgi:phage tail sheath protein FI